MRLAFLLLLFVSFPAFAQPLPEGPPRTGDRAFLFSVEGTNLEAFQGGLGMKWWTGEGRALWAGLQLSAGGEQAEGDDWRTATQALLSAGVEFHPRTPRRLSPFVSVEAGAGLGHYRMRSGQALQPGDPPPRSGFTTLSVQGGVGLGAEFRALDWLSLSATQRLTAQVYRRTELRPYAEDLATTGFSFGTGRPRLTLAVYF